MNNTENKHREERTPAELDALSKAYTESLNSVNTNMGASGDKQSAAYPARSSQGEDTVFKNNRIVEKIRDKNRRLSSSIWTDDPLLKPKKSVWADEDSDVDIKKEPETEPINAGNDSDLLPIEKGLRSEPIIPIIRTGRDADKSENKAETEKKPIKKEFSVRIPEERIREYERASQGSRPLKREELPERRPSAPKPRTDVEIISDKLKADEYARQVQVNSAKAKRMVSITVPVTNGGENYSARQQTSKQSSAVKGKNPTKKSSTGKAVGICAAVMVFAAVCTVTALYAGGFFGKKGNTESAAEQSAAESSVAAADSGSSEIETTAEVRYSGNVIISGSGEQVRAMEVFGDRLAQGSMYAEAVSRWQEELTQCNVYNMCVPLSSAFYLPDGASEENYDPKAEEENIAQGLSGAINVDVLSTLGNHKDEYIYSRTDKYWQPLGSYYAGEVFAEKAGIFYPAIDNYEKVTMYNFTGSYCEDSGNDKELIDNPDSFTYFKPQNNYTVVYYDSYYMNGAEGSMFFSMEGEDCYRTILDCQDKIAKISTDADSERTLVIFTDGTASAFVPFLTEGFSEIYVCNFDSFSLNAVDFCRNVGCTDLLIAASDSFCTDASSAQKLDALREYY